MISIIIITSLVILLYFLYPFWLTLIASDISPDEIEVEEINSVSVILLSYNGKQYLNEKINFLINELSSYKFYELIIIDDHSTDGSRELLTTFKFNEHINILLNTKHQGIPFSMNLGVTKTKYEYVIFCDQRQILSKGIVKMIVEPLKYRSVGAVSGCISVQDKSHKYSFIRMHENYNKIKENKTGSLIGVYGPFYAIKKCCYTSIPENIILDDLYLSLKILKSKKIILMEDCQITDDCISELYDYNRTKRYFKGLLQILIDRPLINDLNYKHLCMLICHKYLRLLIPFFIFTCYITIGFKIFQRIEYEILFIFLSAIGLLAMLPSRYGFHLNIRNIIRLNLFYFIAIVEVIISTLLFQNKASKKNKIAIPELGNIKTK